MEQKRFPIFAERFALLRGDMSQEKFAEFLGISRPTVGFYENGSRLPDVLILKHISEKCDVSSDWLIGISEVRSTNGEVRQVCNYTGLSYKAINWFHDKTTDSKINSDGEFSNFLSRLFEDYFTQSFLYDLYDFHCSVEAQRAMFELYDNLFREETGRYSSNQNENGRDDQIGEKTSERYDEAVLNLDNFNKYSERTKEIIAIQNYINSDDSEKTPIRKLLPKGDTEAISGLYKNRVLTSVNMILAGFEARYDESLRGEADK